MSVIDSYQHTCIGIVQCPSTYAIVPGNNTHRNIPIYRIDEDVHWRVINLSTQQHPMHLHGFYFTVDSLGNGVRDSIFPDARKRRVVTQLMAPDATMSVTTRMALPVKGS